MATYNENIRVQVLVKQDTPHGSFNDAIYISKDEFDTLSDKDVENLAKARVDTWVATIEDIKTRPPREFTKQELIEQQEQAVKHKQSLEAQLAELEQKIRDKEEPIEAGESGEAGAIKGK